MTESLQLSTIQFHGQSLVSFQRAGIVYVVIKHIIEALGLDWKSQSRKLQSDQSYGHMTMPLPTAKGEQETLCLPLSELNGFLFRINANRVKPELRERLMQYQRECFIVLYEHFHPSTPRAELDLAHSISASLKFRIRPSEMA